MNDESILRDVITVRNGEPYREMDVEEHSGGITELGWRIDDTSAGLIEKCRTIVERCSAAEIDGVLVDLFTASTIVQIYDGLSDANKTKLLEMAAGDVGKLGALVWKLVARVKARTS